MSILCKLFGHKSVADRYDGGEYMRVDPGTIDGIGREHACLRAQCPRCRQWYRAGAIHRPESWKAQSTGRERKDVAYRASTTPQKPQEQAA